MGKPTSTLPAFSLVLLLLSGSSFCQGKMVAMKIVEEPSNYGLNAPDHNAQESTLKMRVTPSNFSGPPHLKMLQGRCFSRVEDDYRYELCPFSNVTQHEQSLRWNPYSGVLGVWQEWVIENNTYVGMMMEEGDTCGDIHRSMKIVFECGNKTSVGKVSEPRTCHYQMVLKTPLVCHPHALLVYPTLPENLRNEWDLLEGKVLNEEVTQKGYKKRLHNIFEKAGLVLPPSTKTQISENAKKQETEVVKKETGAFDTLYECKVEYQNLKSEIQGLRTLLEVNGINPDTKNKNDEDEEKRKYPDIDNEEEYPDINNLLLNDYIHENPMDDDL